MYCNCTSLFAVKSDELYFPREGSDSMKHTEEDCLLVKHFLWYSKNCRIPIGNIKIKMLLKIE